MFWGRKKSLPVENQFFAMLRINRLLMIIIFCLILFLFVSFQYVKKPPTIIRLYQDGSSQVQNLQKSHQITKEDLKIFVDSFLLNMNLTDSFHLQSRLAHGLKMMSPQLAEYYLEELLTRKNIDKIMALQWETTTKIVSKKIQKSGEDLTCRITFIRQIHDRSKQREFEIAYSGELVIGMQKRTNENPYGLIVKKWEHDKISTN